MQQPAGAAANRATHAVSTRTTTTTTNNLQGEAGATNNKLSDDDRTTTTITGKPLLRPIIKALLEAHGNDDKSENNYDTSPAPILLVDKINVTTSRSSVTGEKREAFRLWLSDGVMSVQSLFKADALDLLILSCSSPHFPDDGNPDVGEQAGGVREGSYVALGQYEVLRRPRLAGQGFVWVLLVSSLQCVGYDGRGEPHVGNKIDEQKSLPPTAQNSPEKLGQQSRPPPEKGIDDSIILPKHPGEPSDFVLKFNNDLIPVMRDPDTESVDLVPSPAKSTIAAVAVGTPSPKKQTEPLSRISDQSKTSTSSSSKRKASEISGSQPLSPLDANAKRPTKSAGGITEPNDSRATSRPGTGNGRPTTSATEDGKRDESTERRPWKRPRTRDKEPALSAQELLQIHSTEFYNKLKALHEAAEASAAVAATAKEKEERSSLPPDESMSREGRERQPSRLTTTDTDMTNTTASPAKHDYSPVKGSPLSTMTSSQQKRQQLRQTQLQMTPSKAGKAHVTLKGTPGKSIFRLSASPPEYANSPPPGHQPEQQQHFVSPSPKSRFLPATKTTRVTKTSPNNQGPSSSRSRNNKNSSGSIKRPLQLSNSTNTSSPSSLKAITRPLNLTPLASITGPKATRGLIVDILVLISHVNPRVLVRRGFPDSRELLVMDCSTRRQVHLTVFVDAATFNPPVGSVALMRNITTHEYGGGSLKAYYQRCVGTRWFLPEPGAGVDTFGRNGGAATAGNANARGSEQQQQQQREMQGTSTEKWQFEHEAEALRRHWRETPEARTLPEKAWWTERGVAKMMREQQQQQQQQQQQ